MVIQQESKFNLSFEPLEMEMPEMKPTTPRIQPPTYTPLPWPNMPSTKPRSVAARLAAHGIQSYALRCFFNGFIQIHMSKFMRHITSYPYIPYHILYIPLCPSLLSQMKPSSHTMAMAMGAARLPRDPPAPRALRWRSSSSAPGS